MLGVSQRTFQMLEIDRLGKERDRSRFSRKVVARSPGRDENDEGRRVFRENVAAGRRAVEFRHAIVHQNEVRFVVVERLNGFESRSNDLDDLVLAMVDQCRETCSYTPLIVGNKNAHTWEAELLMPASEVVLPAVRKTKRPVRGD